MIKIKSKREIEIMREAGAIVAKCHKYLEKHLFPGVSLKKLDILAEEFIISHGATPSFKNYGGFPGSICTSVNEVVVHGIPDDYKLKDGDIIGIDIGAYYKGYHGDSAWSYGVGNIEEDDRTLLEMTEKALFVGLEMIKPGVRLGSVSNAIQTFAEANGLSVVRELSGHGIGSELHEDPYVPNFGKPDTGVILKENMTIAVEPMLNLGKRNIKTLEDNWTVVTVDSRHSAHFEHTIVITKDGYDILTEIKGE